MPNLLSPNPNPPELEDLYSKDITVWDASKPSTEDGWIMVSNSEWGFDTFHSPAVDKPIMFAHIEKIKSIFFDRIDREHLIRKLPLSLKENEVFIRVDLGKPITPQMDKHASELQKTQKEKSVQITQTKDRGEGVNFLRVLDSFHEGFKPKIAAEIIFPKRKNSTEHYRSQLKLAKKTMTTDYRKWL